LRRCDFGLYLLCYDAPRLGERTKPMKRKPPLILLLVIALLALLPLLAVLQYRWLGQVSEGERERMKNNLNASAKQFGQDFDREVTTIFLAFQPTLHPFSDQTQDDFAARYRHWRDTAAHPRLVSEVYQTVAGEGGGLARLNTSTGVFEPCEWPEKLARLRRTLEASRARRESLRLMLRNVIRGRQEIRNENGGSAMVIHLSFGPVDEDLPGLIVPISEFSQEEFPPLPAPQAFRIVAFDADYIRQEFIPELAKRHFGAVGEYKLAVTKRGQIEQVVYRSDEGVPASAFASGDAIESFFKIRLNEADRFFLARLPGAEGKTGKMIETRSQQIAIKVASDINLAPSEKPPKPEEAVQALFNRKDEGVWQLTVKHRAGSLEAVVASARRRNLAISFGILLLLGASVGFIVLSSRRAQKLATQQMEFVAGVSHELRTPLAVICSAAENLADGVIDNRDQIKRYGGLIRDEGRRLTGMVEQVLEFAGAQSGRKTYDLRATQLNLVIEDAISACHLQLVEGGFEIEKDVAANLPMVKADATALGRAIQNLLSNAMKYSGDSRWIGLSAKSAKTANGEEVVVEVADRGLGIAPSELERIFEPFYRGKDVTLAQIHGNGLGLGLVKQIVEAHGGRVSVESKLGQGSAFTLHLPAVSAEELAAEKSKENYEQAHFAR
jgi:signal transduction histidine kinase